MPDSPFPAATPVGHEDAPAIVARGLCLTVPGFKVPAGAGGINAPGPKPRAQALYILDNIDLRVEQGEVAAIVGPSGSGKTSLLMLMAGLEQPTGGTITVAGTDLGGLGENALAAFRRAQIGIVFQSFHLLPGLTALENVLVPLELAGAPDGMARARAALASVGLEARLAHRPAELSGGEQQRVALARALVARPALLLADEPTGNLDPASGAAVIDLMFGLRRQFGTTLVLVTHDSSLAARCDRQIRLQGGRVVQAEAATHARVGQR
jgi:putative ABC transport system ATP-binding protein